MVTTVSILGENYRIKADLSEEKIILISKMINEKAVKFIEKYKGLSKDKVFLLVAFEMGEELVRLQEVLDYHDRRIREIFKKINSNVKLV